MIKAQTRCFFRALYVHGNKRRPWVKCVQKNKSHHACLDAWCFIIFTLAGDTKTNKTPPSIKTLKAEPRKGQRPKLQPATSICSQLHYMVNEPCNCLRYASRVNKKGQYLCTLAGHGKAACI